MSRVEKISWENPKLPFLRPLTFRCLHPGCQGFFIEVGFDAKTLKEMSKEKRYRLKIEALKIKPTAYTGPCPFCGCLGERIYKEIE